MTEMTPTAAAVAVSISRRMVALTVGASLFSLLFVLSYGYAIHSPRPHDVRIDVVAAPAAVAAITQALQRAEPGGFAVRADANAAQARRAVSRDHAYGALVVPAAGRDILYTASAGGVAVAQVVTGALTHVAAAQGRLLEQVDLIPLPAGDRAGGSSFVFEIGLLIPAVVGSVGFYLLGRRARLWVRIAAAAGYAVLASAFGVLVLDVILGALTGSPWTLMATGTLTAAAFVLTIAALHAVLGLPGTGLAAGVLLVIGNALNGSTVPIPMLPDGYRQLAGWLPNASAVQAFRSDTYFSGQGQGHALMVLALWVGVALLVLGATDALHLRRRRLAPDTHQKIHATPLLTLVAQRRAVAGSPVASMLEVGRVDDLRQLESGETVHDQRHRVHGRSGRLQVERIEQHDRSGEISLHQIPLDDAAAL